MLVVEVVEVVEVLLRKAEAAVLSVLRMELVAVAVLSVLQKELVEEVVLFRPHQVAVVEAVEEDHHLKEPQEALQERHVESEQPVYSWRQLVAVSSAVADYSQHPALDRRPVQKRPLHLHC